ncbi:uncharacterized protein [Montipora foliosa]|uniref:uncharacterized protein n=1 Tax=Montipora foliosa TaxID=591990 RepID=UPI0035F20ADF
MEASKLLRSRRSSDSRKKRKKEQKALDAKRRKSRNARIAKAGSSKLQSEKTNQKCEPEDAKCHDDKPAREEKLKGKSGIDNEAQRYHKHALYFYSKWKEAETEKLLEIEESSLIDLQIEIGSGCFGVCSLAKYGAQTVVVKQQGDSAASKHEARMTAKLRHPNLVCFLGVVERNNRVDIITHFHSVNGQHTNLSTISTENAAAIHWRRLIRGLCEGIRYLHENVKILHNDIKANNVVLDGCNFAEVEGVLIDFGKATEQISPKIYRTPADTKKFKHLAPELGKANGKQSKSSDIYSFGYLIRCINYKYPNVPSVLIDLYRSCLRSNPWKRPSANDLCEHVGGT